MRTDLRMTAQAQCFYDRRVPFFGTYAEEENIQPWCSYPWEQDNVAQALLTYYCQPEYEIGPDCVRIDVMVSGYSL